MRIWHTRRQWMYGVTASCSVSPRTAEEGAECLPGGAKGKCELRVRSVHSTPSVPTSAMRIWHTRRAPVDSHTSAGVAQAPSSESWPSSGISPLVSWICCLVQTNLPTWLHSTPSVPTSAMRIWHTRRAPVDSHTSAGVEGTFTALQWHFATRLLDLLPSTNKLTHLVTIQYSSTPCKRALDPSRGVRVQLAVTPYIHWLKPVTSALM
jgi:hypothetical protein